MEKIYIFGVEEDYNKIRVTTIHYQPNHPKHGLSDEQKAKGWEVDKSLLPPRPERVRGKNHVLYFNPQTNEFWYEKKDRPLTPEEQQEVQYEKIDLLIQMMLEKEGII